MNKLQKVALIGLGITVLITILLYFIFGASPRYVAPFYLPWAFLFIIGLTNKKRKE